MATPKTTSKEIDSYISGYAKDVQAILEKVRTTIRKAAPNAHEIMNYGIPTFGLRRIWCILPALRVTSGSTPRPVELRSSKKNYQFTRAQKVRSSFRWTNLFHMN